MDHAQRLKTSVPGKIMELLIRDNNRKQPFSPEQHGFKNGKSCTIQLLEILEDLTEALYAGNDVDLP